MSGDQTICAHIGRTPLVELTRLSAGLPRPVWAKCEHLNPAGSVKDRIALAIVEAAEGSGRLAPGATLIEATAGNTGLGLAMVAAVRGYRLICVMPEKMSQDKRRALRCLGAEVVITPNVPPDHPDNFQNRARTMAEEGGYFLTDQFCNPANVKVHQDTTGPEIWQQSGGRVAAFVAGVGTGGTITGVGRCLKSHNQNLEVVLADPLGSGLGNYVLKGCYGPDAAYAVEGIGSSRCPENLDPAVVDRVETVDDAESFAMTGRLIREEGLLVGGSAGTAVAAALRIAAEPGEGVVVALLPDSWDRYHSCGWMDT